MGMLGGMLTNILRQRQSGGNQATNRRSGIGGLGSLGQMVMSNMRQRQPQNQQQQRTGGFFSRLGGMLKQRSQQKPSPRQAAKGPTIAPATGPAIAPSAGGVPQAISPAPGPAIIAPPSGPPQPTTGPAIAPSAGGVPQQLTMQPRQRIQSLQDRLRSKGLSGGGG